MLFSIFVLSLLFGLFAAISQLNVLLNYVGIHSSKTYFYIWIAACFYVCLLLIQVGTYNHTKFMASSRVRTPDKRTAHEGIPHWGTKSGLHAFFFTVMIVIIIKYLCLLFHICFFVKYLTSDPHDYLFVPFIETR